MCVTVCIVWCCDGPQGHVFVCVAGIVYVFVCALMLKEGIKAYTSTLGGAGGIYHGLLLGGWFTLCYLLSAPSRKVFLCIC